MESSTPQAPSYLPAVVARWLRYDEGEPLSQKTPPQYSDSKHIAIDIDESTDSCIDIGGPPVRGYDANVDNFNAPAEGKYEDAMFDRLHSDQARNLLSVDDQDQQDCGLLYGMRDKLCWAGSKFCSAVKFVTQLEATTPLGRRVCTLANITARQVLFSVFLQTTVRQIFARFFGQLTENNPTLGWVMGVMPTVVVLTLNLWGHFHDLRSGQEVEALIKDFSDSVRGQVKEFNPNVDEEQITDFCARLVQQVTEKLENHDAIQAVIYAKSDLRVSQEINDYPAQDDQILMASPRLNVSRDEISMNSLGDGSRRKKPSLPQLSLPAKSGCKDEAHDGITLVESPRHRLEQENPELLEAIQNEAITLQNNLKDKTWPTSTVTFLRCASSIAIGTLSGVAAYTGVLPTIGATLSAYALYCVEREIAQVFFPCPDGLPKYYAKATFKAAACYVPNQLLAGFAMATLAGSSGQAAVGLTFMEALKNDLKRGCFNSLGEIVDLIVLVLGQSVQNDVPFEVKLGFVKITNYEELKEAMVKLQNTFTSLGAARLGIFQETVLFSSLFFNFVQIDESVGELGKKALVAFVEALYLGCRYADLPARGGRVNWPYDSKVQSTSATQR